MSLVDNTVLVDYQDRTYVAEIGWDEFEECYVLASLLDEGGREVDDPTLEDLALDKALPVMEHRWAQEPIDE